VFQLVAGSASEIGQSFGKSALPKNNLHGFDRRRPGFDRRRCPRRKPLS
jgi:hypothetical protein